ncbi:hypothetical protein BRD09_05870 [Halobacteriales archaeon SW_10_68_16]|nr:MAG: hypothetical protein BRD09_05870 [Halobacteriales archaeon SW_10_68_16]
MSLSTDTPDVSNSGEGPASEHQPRTTVRNGLLGGVVGLVLSFLPFSTVLGGLVAGYLQDGAAIDGATAGTIAGLTALVPPAVAAAVAVHPAVTVPVGTVAPTFLIAAGVFVASVYVVGFSVLGGALGASLRRHVRE